MTPADLIAFRERHGLSLSEAAALLGVGRMTWWRWEAAGTHHRDPPPYLWRAVEHAEQELSASG